MKFLFVGHALWLDFLNTETGDPGSASRCDRLQGAADLAAWQKEADVDCEVGGQAWLERARSLRARMRRGAELLLEQGDRTALVGAVDKELSGHPAVWRLSPDAAVGRLEVRPLAVGPDELFYRVALDCAESIASGQLAGLRRCEREGCTILFLDKSKNRTRRWCSMELCGNRQKAAEHRIRHGQAIRES